MGKTKEIVLTALAIALTGCGHKSVTSALAGGDSTIPGPNTPVLWVIGAGQSNMSNENQSTEFPASARITMYNGPRVGPSYAFAMAFLSDHPNYRVKVIQCGWGGSPTSYWAVGGVAFNQCVQRAAAAGLTKASVILFSQGETEAMDNVEDSWTQGFESFVSGMRAQLGTTGTPVIFAQTGTIDPAKWDTAKLLQIQTEQAGVAMVNVNMVYTADQPTVDGLHHSYDANAVIGARMADAFRPI